MSHFSSTNKYVTAVFTGLASLTFTAAALPINPITATETGIVSSQTLGSTTQNTITLGADDEDTQCEADVVPTGLTASILISRSAGNTKITFVNESDTCVTVGAATYEVPVSGDPMDGLPLQRLFDSAGPITIGADETKVIYLDIPDCKTQIDAFMWNPNGVIEHFTYPDGGEGIGWYGSRKVAYKNLNDLPYCQEDQEPTPTPTDTQEPTPTPTDTPEETPTPTQELTPTPTDTTEEEATPTPTSTIAPTPTPTNPDDNQSEKDSKEETNQVASSSDEAAVGGPGLVLGATTDDMTYANTGVFTDILQYAGAMLSSIGALTLKRRK